MTNCPKKEIVKELSNPGVKVIYAAVEVLDVSLPIVPIKGEVVIAAPGFVIPPIVINISATKEVEAKALLIVTVRLLTLQLTPDILTPLILTSIHVAPDIIEFVYSAGNTIVAVSVEAKVVDAHGV